MQPVDHDVGQNGVAVDGILRTIDGAGPVLEPFDDPGQLTDRRVRQRVGEGLRSGGLQYRVSDELVLIALRFGQRRLVLRVVGIGGVGLSRCGQQGGQVQRYDVLGVVDA